ncbi:hypothetical protein TorRG33x02_296170 [Trema orientale]|uniref:Uncharacterized protein n=1 Tax=Trema orientale TaxID=63057 RepID=A0A2P5C5X4_TREOI|nr:hypothetical protein TorRG33x02_296170 [Trema orientale]
MILNHPSIRPEESPSPDRSEHLRPDLAIKRSSLGAKSL